MSDDTCIWCGNVDCDQLPHPDAEHQEEYTATVIQSMYQDPEILALNVVTDYINDCIRAEDFLALAALFSLTDPTKIYNIRVMVAPLQATVVYQKMPERHTYYTRVEQHLRELGRLEDLLP